jgi:hypothetical protein
LRSPGDSVGQCRACRRLQRQRAVRHHQFGDEVAVGLVRRASGCQPSADNATRQPAFVAIGQFDGYFNDHPEQADEVRAIKAPLIDYQNRCGMQVAPAEALVVLSEL